jgi:hypothetical protein
MSLDDIRNLALAMEAARESWRPIQSASAVHA